jgi:hypothetical protein
VQGESACADYTLLQETIPPSHLRLPRSDCPCSRQRATPPTESTSKHGPTPTSSLLPTPGIQEQPAVQTALLNHKTNHSDSSAYSEVTANAVINEQLSGPIAQSSNPPKFWRCKRSLPYRLPLALQQAASKKKIHQAKIIQGRRQVEIPESLLGKTSNRSSTRMTPPGTERMVCRR